MLPRWITVENLKVGDVFMRQDRVSAQVESIQPNPKDVGRLWLSVRILDNINCLRQEPQQMDLSKSGEQGHVLLVREPLTSINTTWIARQKYQGQFPGTWDVVKYYEDDLIPGKTLVALAKTDLTKWVGLYVSAFLEMFLCQSQTVYLAPDEGMTLVKEEVSKFQETLVDQNTTTTP